MFKLKYTHVQDYQFVQALAKICNHSPYKSTKVAYNLAKIKRKFEQEAEMSQTLYVKLVKQYCHLDAKGEIAPRKDKDGKDIPATFEIKTELLDKWAEAKKDFDATEFEINCHKVHLADLDGVDISPADMDRLADLIDETEPVKAAPTLASIKPAQTTNNSLPL